MTNKIGGGLFHRRKTMADPESEIEVPLTWAEWGANTRWKSNIFDATEHDVYITIPYVEGYSGFASDVTENSYPYRIAATVYPSETEARIGVYWSGTIHDSLNTSSVPKQKFGEHLVVPKGYWVSIGLIKADAFSSNNNAKKYLDNYVGYATLRKR